MRANLLTILCAILFALMPTTASGQQQDKTKDMSVSAFIENAVTGVSVPDTIYAEIMTPDSVVIADIDVEPNTTQMESNGVTTGYKTMMKFPFKGAGNNFILRLSHPDYADAYYPVEMKGATAWLGTLKIRKLNAFERAKKLGEVVVKASVIQVVNKGDTIQYNADAFDVAKGSMLDALLAQMPGVELRGNGRIYVNGRFVEKMLLDGKDFFEGNNFVLLENLPAYTVKNIKVYEQTSQLSKVIGNAASMVEPNKYVIDVTLKKGFNTGWLANAEAGAGTHSRYRGRAFGLGYTKSLRLSAFGMINNINEKRTPGGDGRWNPASDLSGITRTKAGGLDYNYSSPGRTINFMGNTTLKHDRTTNNTLTNKENYLETGNTFSRQWSDGINRNLNLYSYNYLNITPKSNSYMHSVRFSLSYNNNRRVSDIVRGTFGRNIGDAPALRDRLSEGWIEDMDAINRYLSSSDRRIKDFGMGMSYSYTVAVGGQDRGLTLYASGEYNRTTTGEPDYDSYLVQYAGRPANGLSRSNPLDKRNYTTNLAADWHRAITPELKISPRLDFFYDYNRNSNLWYADSIGERLAGMLPSMRSAAMMQLDPQNSYLAGEHRTVLRPRIPILFSRQTKRDGKAFSKFTVRVNLEARLHHDEIKYDGIVRSQARKTYASPNMSVDLSGENHWMRHSWSVGYHLDAEDIDLINLIDVTFNSDPLNLFRGNPDLKNSYSHNFSARYGYNNWLFNRVMFSITGRYVISRRDMAMSYAYDPATGVHTYRPVNINGNRYGTFSFNPTVALDRNKKFTFRNQLSLTPRRSVDLVSYNAFASSSPSVVRSLGVSESATLQYNVKKYMVALDGAIETQRSRSDENYFEPFTMTQFNYGLRGRYKFTEDFEISTDLKMYSTRGFDYSEMNTNQLVWNGRVTKSFLDGKLMMILDGYDILGKVKRISYKVNEQGRTETWVNSIPSYVMLSLRWNFAKKPRE